MGEPTDAGNATCLRPSVFKNCGDVPAKVDLRILCPKCGILPTHYYMWKVPDVELEDVTFPQLDLFFPHCDESPACKVRVPLGNHWSIIQPKLVSDQ